MFGFCFCCTLVRVLFNLLIHFDLKPDTSTNRNSNSPVPSISSSIIDQTKNSDDSAQESIQNQNQRDKNGSSDDDDDGADAGNSATTAAKSTTRGAGRKPITQTPKKATNKRNATNTSNDSVSKDSADETENCRVSVCHMEFYFFSEIHHSIFFNIDCSSTPNPHHLFALKNLLKSQIGCYIHATAV